MNRQQLRRAWKKTRKIMGQSWPEFAAGFTRQEPYVNEGKKVRKSAKV